MWLQKIPSVALALFAVTTSAANPLEQHTHQQRGLETEADMLSLSSKSCECEATPRPCLFIPGERNKQAEKELQTSSDYFGDMSDHAPCCSSIKYASLDTDNVGWTDETLQNTVCNHALSMSESSKVDEKVIKDTILVTHSMGALIVAGAVANQRCSIDNSTAWVSMSAPMYGTMASNYAQDTCTDEQKQSFSKVLALLGKCPVGAGMQSIAYMGGKYSTLALNDAYKAAQEVYRNHVSALMCSNANRGILSTDQLKYQALDQYIQHGTDEHDGIVTYESCRGGLPTSMFGTESSETFYVSTCNHADTAFRHGNGYAFVSSKRQPVKWFECLFSK